MEWYCGHLILATKSRLNPYGCLNNYIKREAQLHQIQLQFDLEDVFTLKRKEHDSITSHKKTVPGCEFILLPCLFLWVKLAFLEDDLTVLHFPQILKFRVEDSIRRKIAKYFTNVFSALGGQALNYMQIEVHLPDTMEQWGKVRVDKGGDMIQGTVVAGNPYDRNASFIRVRRFPLFIQASLTHLPSPFCILSSTRLWSTKTNDSETVLMFPSSGHTTAFFTTFYYVICPETER
jgi:hypothetical protein